MVRNSIEELPEDVPFIIKKDFEIAQGAGVSWH